MKLNLESVKKKGEARADGATKTTQRATKPKASAQGGPPKRFRRLKANELVSNGDFVVDQQRGFELWEGPNGFRADSFVKAIYRQDKRRSPAAKKSK